MPPQRKKLASYTLFLKEFSREKLLISMTIVHIKEIQAEFNSLVTELKRIIPRHP